jgi:hypothetical protein
MPRIKVEEGRITEIKFGTDHNYLANLLACTKILGIPLSKARTLCKSHPDMNIKVDPPLPIISKLPTDAIHAELDEYTITVKITIN